jgi:diguanylate cyclase (GGDEF)-like protein
METTAIVSDRHKRSRASVYRYTIALIAAWTVIIAISLTWNIIRERQNTRELALKEARIHFNKDQAFRSWAALHGGVYVTPTAMTPPNPYLNHIPERDITTASGKSLTLINPAYMLRQVKSFYSELYGVKGRLTSLKVINPVNEPDEWERSTLMAFEEGEKEVFEFTHREGEPHLRFMRPLMTEKECLKCHGFQGYKVGDVRGGITVSVPLNPYLAIENKTIHAIALSHGIFWILGLFAIGLASNRIKKRVLERNLAREELEHQAFYDKLTSLPNRALFIQYLDDEIPRTKENRDYKFAVLFIDLDRFKNINDSLGHVIGDQLLVAAADTLKYCVRPDDEIARFGGDEFAILLRNCKDVSGATRTSDRIQKKLSMPFRLGKHEMFVSASIGIALSETGYENAEDVLRDADTAMYRAKARGRACYELFDTQMYTAAMNLLQLESDLRKAVENREFEVHYQPIISLADDSIVGAEAIIRWDHPQRGSISPNEFIPLAEETGLISELGDWILRAACSQNRAWHGAGYEHLLMKVNFSACQFYHEDILRFIKKALRESNLNAEFLDIEITESIAADDKSINLFNELSSMGVKISIDDFGTGYSSLGSLKRLPINTIKIDRSFVRDIVIDNHAGAIVKTIVSMAHNLNMKVLAEGVETKEQLQFLKSQDCDEAQGFLFSPPIPDIEFSRLLAKSSK